MTIEKLKEIYTNAEWDTIVECDFITLKKQKDILNFTGIYFLVDENKDVVYIGSAYTRNLRSRLLQYQQNKNSGNSSLYRDLIEGGKTTEDNAHHYIINLKIYAIKDESTEYQLIKSCPTTVNLVGKNNNTDKNEN